MKNIKMDNDLLYAAEYCELEKVIGLVERGADPNARDNNESTPLHYAAIRGATEIVDVLLDRGADPDFVDRGGRTPSHCALETGHNEIFHKLFKKNVNKTKPTIDRALVIAAGRGRTVIVKHLLTEGASPNAKDGNKHSALNIAADIGNLKMVQILLAEHANVNAQDDSGFTPLHRAAMNGYGKIVDALLDKGADRNYLEVNGHKPLEWAAMEGHDEIFCKLFTNDITQRDIDAALVCAAAGQYTELSTFLLAAGANFNVEIDAESKYFHRLAVEGYKETVDTLLNKEAEDSVEHKGGNSVLKALADDLTEEVCQLVVSDKDYTDSVNTPGADRDCDEICGRTLLCLAEKQGNTKIIDVFFTERTSIVDNELRISAMDSLQGNICMCITKRFIAKSCTTSIKDSNSTLPLSPELKNFLYRLGPAVNVVQSWCDIL